MARGWGRSEEELEADKEQDREARRARIGQGGSGKAPLAAVKIGTWNVNGIRAREAQVAAWIERDRPDVVCLQEIKASSAQIPAMLCEMEGYWCYWHGEKGYSGVGLHVRKETFPERPEFGHPDFDY